MKKPSVCVGYASVFVLWLLTSGAQAQGVQSPQEIRSYLTSHIHYLDDKKILEPCASTLLPPGVVGGLAFALGTEVDKILHLSDISTIDVIGDDMTLPSPTIVQTLTEGKLGQGLMALLADDIVSVQVRMKNDNCYAFTFFPKSAPGRVKSGGALVDAPKPPEKCSADISKIQSGMTRVELEKIISADGGIYAPFHNERYIVRNCPLKDRVVKLNIKFKPAGMNDYTYNSDGWMLPRQSENDTVMLVSSPYLDFSHAD